MLHGLATGSRASRQALRIAKDKPMRSGGDSFVWFDEAKDSGPGHDLDIGRRLVNCAHELSNKFYNMYIHSEFPVCPPSHFLSFFEDS